MSRRSQRTFVSGPALLPACGLSFTQFQRSPLSDAVEKSERACRCNTNTECPNHAFNPPTIRRLTDHPRERQQQRQRPQPAQYDAPPLGSRRVIDWLVPVQEEMDTLRQINRRYYAPKPKLSFAPNALPNRSQQSKKHAVGECVNVPRHILPSLPERAELVPVEAREKEHHEENGRGGANQPTCLVSRQHDFNVRESLWSVNVRPGAAAAHS